MSQEQTRGDMEKIVARAIDDEDFRRRLGENPEATIESEGYVLDADEMAAIKQNVDPDLSQEQLENRVSKATFWRPPGGGGNGVLEPPITNTYRRIPRP